MAHIEPENRNVIPSDRHVGQRGFELVPAPELDFGSRPQCGDVMPQPLAQPLVLLDGQNPGSHLLHPRRRLQSDGASLPDYGILQPGESLTRVTAREMNAERALANRA